jgi:hypothetical protein
VVFTSLNDEFMEHDNIHSTHAKVTVEMPFTDQEGSFFKTSLSYASSALDALGEPSSYTPRSPKTLISMRKRKLEDLPY